MNMEIVEEETTQTRPKRYRVTNIYDRDCLIDDQSVVIMEAGRGPDVRQLEGFAARFNRLEMLREAAEAALPIVDEAVKRMSRVSLATAAQYGEVAQQLRAALVDSQPTEG